MAAFKLFINNYIHQYQQHAVKSIFKRNGIYPYAQVFCIGIGKYWQSGKQTVYNKKGNQ